MRNIQDFDTEGNNTVRRMVRELPTLAVPDYLQTKLKVTASRERSRAAAHRTIAATFHTWADRMALLYGNLMRPLALPFAGGIVSAITLFGFLFPQLVSGQRPLFDSPSGFWKREGPEKPVSRRPIGFRGSPLTVGNTRSGPISSQRLSWRRFCRPGRRRRRTCCWRCCPGR